MKPSSSRLVDLRKLPAMLGLVCVGESRIDGCRLELDLMRRLVEHVGCIGTAGVGHVGSVG